MCTGVWVRYTPFSCVTMETLVFIQTGESFANVYSGRGAVHTILRVTMAKLVFVQRGESRANVYLGPAAVHIIFMRYDDNISVLLAGDFRVNVYPSLGALHTICMRYHDINICTHRCQIEHGSGRRIHHFHALPCDSCVFFIDDNKAFVFLTISMFEPTIVTECICVNVYPGLSVVPTTISAFVPTGDSRVHIYPYLAALHAIFIRYHHFQV